MNRAVHFEIPAENVDRAKKFYKDCFNWNIISYGNMQYNMIHTGPTDEEDMHKDDKPPFINGGMLKRQDCVQHPVLTLLAPNMEESIKKIKKAGGQIVKEPFKVGDIGISAYFKDTEGNILGLWQPLREM